MPTPTIEPNNSSLPPKRTPHPRNEIAGCAQSSAQIGDVRQPESQIVGRPIAAIGGTRRTAALTDHVRSRCGGLVRRGATNHRAGTGQLETKAKESPIIFQPRPTAERSHQLGHLAQSAVHDATVTIVRQQQSLLVRQRRQKSALSSRLARAEPRRSPDFSPEIRGTTEWTRRGNAC